MEYAWEKGRRISVKAEVVGEAIDRIKERYGDLTAQRLVDYARPVRSRLHSAFNWNDQEAAEKFRAEQARGMIRSIRIVIAEQEEPQIAYVKVVKPDGAVYMATGDALSDEQYRSQVLKDALTGLVGWKRRYEHLQEMAGVVSAINTVT
tara:strand:- start:133 stop:579 length:447 start_codon:yes stop_codon:yes gene_type:complete